ncbi:MAG: hypothetical protein ACOC1K_01195 [Nanoarchaeota archaeon]
MKLKTKVDEQKIFFVGMYSGHIYKNIKESEECLQVLTKDQLRNLEARRLFNRMTCLSCRKECTIK